MSQRFKLLQSGRDRFRLLKSALVFVTVCLCLPIWQQAEALAQEQSVESAQRFANAQKYEEAKIVYEAILRETPDNIEALTGYGFLLSWQGQQESARIQFQKALSLQSGSCDAAVGLAYSYAWSAEYEHAKSHFAKAITCNPDRMDAKKGLAHTYLWNGEYQAARMLFEKLAEIAPEDAEIHAGLGQALSKAGKHKASKREFEKSLELSPGREDALLGLQALNSLPALFEIIGWVGNSAFAGDNKLGLRNLELAMWPTITTRIWARYDQSLELDNLALIRNGLNAKTYFAGVLHNWQNKGIYTRVEFGQRTLPGDQSQTLLQLEQLMPLKSNTALRVGGLLSSASGAAEWNLYSGFQFPLSSKIRLEPMFYYTSLAVDGANEHRFALAGQYQFAAATTLNWGVYFGKTDVAAGSNDGDISGIYAFFAMPFKQHQNIYFLYRTESTPQAEFAMGAIGLKLSLPR